MKRILEIRLRNKKTKEVCTKYYFLKGECRFNNRLVDVLSIKPKEVKNELLGM